MLGDPNYPLAIHFDKFWAPFASLEWMKLDTSNLIQRLTMASLAYG